MKRALALAAALSALFGLGWGAALYRDKRQRELANVGEQP